MNLDPKTRAGITLALSVFLGWVGADRFYQKQWLTGALKLITIGGFFIWWAIDIIYYAYRYFTLPTTRTATPNLTGSTKAQSFLASVQTAAVNAQARLDEFNERNETRARRSSTRRKYVCVSFRRLPHGWTEKDIHELNMSAYTYKWRPAAKPKIGDRVTVSGQAADADHAFVVGFTNRLPIGYDDDDLETVTKVIGHRPPYVPHNPPRPTGKPIKPWVEKGHQVQADGLEYQNATVQALLGPLHESASWDYNERTVPVELFPDATHPKKRGLTTIAVWVEGKHLGYLNDDDAEQYLPLIQKLAAEPEPRHFVTTAVVRGLLYERERYWKSFATVSLPPIEGMLATNDLPSNPEIIPMGRVIQVVGEEENIDELKTLVRPGEITWFAGTLRPAKYGKSALYETAEVYIGNVKVGAFSRASGSQIAELIKLICDAGRTPVVRLSLEGNTIKVEGKVYMQRASEFSEDRVRELQTIATERKFHVNHRGQEFDWDDEAPGRPYKGDDAA
ncbi:TM2 domain-containing protein [Dermabacter hominis]